MQVTKAGFVVAMVMAGVRSIARGVWAQQAPDPILGTWQMDASKSKFSPSNRRVQTRMVPR